MSAPSQSTDWLRPEILAHYEQGQEAQRLLQQVGQLELTRTQELLSRYLPAPPAVIFDIGGGAGVYASWLAKQSYEVHLIDPVPLHIEQAHEVSQTQPDYPLAGVVLGDARHIDRIDASVDAVLLLGPLYHLIERRDRITALQEAHRILKPKGLIFAVGISRFASVLDGLFREYLDDPTFVEIAKQDLTNGQHRNPKHHPTYFTTAFLHHPEELQTEVQEAGFIDVTVFAIEGAGWLLRNFEEHWADPDRRDRLLQAVRWLETEPSTLGVSAHLMAIAKKVS